MPHLLHPDIVATFVILAIAIVLVAVPIIVILIHITFSFAALLAFIAVWAAGRVPVLEQVICIFFVIGQSEIFPRPISPLEGVGLRESFVVRPEGCQRPFAQHLFWLVTIFFKRRLETLPVPH